MIISEQWLRDWVSLDLNAQEIADCLTLAGLEVDAVSQLAGQVDKLVVGMILETSKHPDADRLKLTKVDIGEQVLDIVCGAPNAREGLMVAVATEGAKLPNGLKIKKAKVRGIESNGMLCSAAELGLEDSSDGLIELDHDAELGQRVDEYLQLDDTLIDIDLTPNRGDCLSVQGVARELKVLAEGSYHPLDIADIEASVDANIEIELQDDIACPRYIGRVISGIDQTVNTPLWLQERLRRSGVRPISPVVDITNYVMLELGQPMHAFDHSKLEQRIIVRQSQKGEKITLLDDSQAELDGDTLVIADSNGPIAIAGVMGGLHSAIDEATTDIVLEAAHFTRKSASGRARRYGLHTESSHRFERGVDPMLPTQAVQRATQLILDICGGQAGPVLEQKRDQGLQAKPRVAVRLARLSSLLGMPLAEQEVGGILNRIAEQVESEQADSPSAQWQVTPPSYRFDIEHEADLVEEVARVKGYDSVPVAMPRIAPRSTAASEQSTSERSVRASLIAREYQEAITYSFVDPAVHALYSELAPIAISNPLAENMSVMRTSLLPGLLGALEFNVNRQHERVRLFEIGATYQQTEEGIEESQTLAAVVTGSRYPVQWEANNGQAVDFYDLKGDLEAVLALTGYKEPFIFNRFEHIAMHPGQVSLVTRSELNGSETELGWIGRLHPQLQNKLGLSLPIYTFEINLCKALKAQLPVFNKVSRFPSVKRDLSVLVSQDIQVADMVSAVRSELGEVLSKLVIFDIYRGEGVEKNQKSVSLSLVMQDNDKTLTDAESESLMNAALELLKRDFDARLRV